MCLHAWNLGQIVSSFHGIRNQCLVIFEIFFLFLCFFTNAFGKSVQSSSPDCHHLFKIIYTIITYKELQCSVHTQKLGSEERGCFLNYKFCLQEPELQISELLGFRRMLVHIDFACSTLRISDYEHVWLVRTYFGRKVRTLSICLAL